MIFCLDLVYYLPTRRFSQRKPVIPAIGITNYDVCEKTYWLIGEIDGELPPEFVPKYRDILSFIVKSVKGYHIYFNICSKNPLKVIHMGYRLGLDRGHLKLGRSRESRKLVLRLWGKYETDPFVRPVVVFDIPSVWHYQVLSLIRDLMVNVS